MDEHLVCHTEGRTQTEGVSEWGAEENIWAEGRGSGGGGEINLCDEEFNNFLLVTTYY
jgi:hypothetical protein